VVHPEFQIPVFRRQHTVKAINFGPHGNFGPFLARSILFWVNSVPKMDRTNFANQKFVYKFLSIHFTAGRVLKISSPSEGKVQS
jgi:hypothetical protein